jgi:hypothetical protein
MAITISGTTVTYNDSSTTTTNTPNATAALTAGTLGSYAQLTYPGNAATRSADFTIAGSSLRYSDTISSVGGTPSGSWRLMGNLGSFATGGGKVPPGTGYAVTSVWLRYA